MTRRNRLPFDPIDFREHIPDQGVGSLNRFQRTARILYGNRLQKRSLLSSGPFNNRIHITVLTTETDQQYTGKIRVPQISGKRIHDFVVAFSTDLKPATPSV